MFAGLQVSKKVIISYGIIGSLMRKKLTQNMVTLNRLVMPDALIGFSLIGVSTRRLYLDFNLERRV